MKKCLIVISILCASNMHATNWFCWLSKYISFKRYHETWSSDLRDAANQVKANYNLELSRSKNKCNVDLMDEMINENPSSFFTDSKYNYGMKGIFNTSEVSCMVRDLLIKKKTQSNMQEVDGAESEEVEVKKPSKIKTHDIRELPHLGQIKIDDNQEINKFKLDFKGSLVNNQILLKVSIAEQKLGTKQMQDRGSKAIAGVACIKKDIEHMMIGRENEDGTFSWTKTIHNRMAIIKELDEEKDNPKRKERNPVSFSKAEPDSRYFTKEPYEDETT